MLHDFDKYKNYQPPIVLETKYNRGYSFYKTGISLHHPPARDNSFSAPNNEVSDNFFFPSKREQPKLSKEPK